MFGPEVLPGQVAADVIRLMMPNELARQQTWALVLEALLA